MRDWIKHLSSQNLEPFSRDTPGVDAFFIKADAEFAVRDLFARLPVKVLIAIFEDVRSSNIKLYHRVVVAAVVSVEVAD